MSMCKQRCSFGFLYALALCILKPSFRNRGKIIIPWHFSNVIPFPYSLGDEPERLGHNETSFVDLQGKGHRKHSRTAPLEFSSLQHKIIPQEDLRSARSAPSASAHCTWPSDVKPDSCVICDCLHFLFTCMCWEYALLCRLRVC